MKRDEFGDRDITVSSNPILHSNESLLKGTNFIPIDPYVIRCSHYFV